MIINYLYLIEEIYYLHLQINNSKFQKPFNKKCIRIIFYNYKHYLKNDKYHKKVINICE